MCYSAQVCADYRLDVRQYGAVLDIKEFYELFWRRGSDSKIKIPKAMEAAFRESKNEAEKQIKSAIEAFAAEQAVKLEQDLFKQRKRLADAERVCDPSLLKRQGRASGLLPTRSTGQWGSFPI